MECQKFRCFFKNIFDFLSLFDLSNRNKIMFKHKNFFHMFDFTWLLKLLFDS